MNKTFFTSDTHFNHESILKYTKRPWATVPEMNEGLIELWNQTVGPEDIVYHLGDFAMGQRVLIPEVLARLNGRIILVQGNHDYKKSLVHFSEVHQRLVIEVEGQRVELAHNPGHLQFDCDLALCGHVHENWHIKLPGEVIPPDEVHDHEYQHPEIVSPGIVFNVGVDVNGYKPLTFAQIRNKIGEQHGRFQSWQSNYSIDRGRFTSLRYAHQRI